MAYSTMSGDKAPTLTSIPISATPISIVTEAEINDTSSSVNNKHISGKKKGSMYLVERADGSLALATASGSGTDDEWEISETEAVVQGKADKVTSATAGNLAELDAEGNIIDSGITTIKPDINPTLDLDFENEKFRIYTADGFEEFPLNGVDSKFNFTRAGTKTYFDAKGVMRTAADGEMAIDYDPVTGESLGVKLEGPGTNLLEHSEDFSNADWTKTRSSIGGDAVVVPDGSSVVCKLIEDTSTDTHHIRQFPTTLGNYVLSVYAKAGEKSKIGLAHYNTTQGNLYGRFDLSSGTVIEENGGDATITDAGSGWFRCCISFNSVDSGDVKMALLNDEPSASYTGDGTSGLYIWGAQLEESESPSSYIPTTTAAVTRNADQLKIDGTNFSDFYNQGEGTVFVEATRPGEIPASGVSAFPTLFHFNDGTDNNRINTGGTRVSDTQGNWSFAGRVSGATQWSGLANTNIDNGDVFKLAGSFKVDDIAAAVNGAAVSTDSSASIPTVDRLHIGYTASSSQFLNGHIKRLTYWARRLDDVILQALTK